MVSKSRCAREDCGRHTAGHHVRGYILENEAVGCYQRVVADGDVARAWGHKDVEQELAAKRARAKELIAKTKAEEWAINPSVHFNEWANLQAHEFRDVADAFRDLLESLRCEEETCRSYLYVSPRKGNAEEIRCNCGSTGINLRMRA